MTFQSLRRLYGALDEEMFWVAGRAFQIMDWDRTHQYCGSADLRQKDKADERAKVCPTCGTVSFPRMSPAIIVRGGSGQEDSFGSCRKVSGGYVQCPCRVCRARGILGGLRAARGQGRGRARGQEHPLLRKPALAFSPIR